MTHAYAAAYFARKPDTISDVLDARQHAEAVGAKLEQYNILKDLLISVEEYNAFVADMGSERFASWFTGTGGTIDGVAQVTRLQALGRRDLLVNTEGYSYARYVALMV